MLKTLDGPDYLLLLLYLNDKAPICGAVRLTKMMFLFNEEIAPKIIKSGFTIEKLPAFIAYNFGPFSKDVYEQLELFRNIDFIKITNILIKDNEEMAESDDWEEPSFIDELVLPDKEYLNQDGKYMKYEIAANGSRYVEQEVLKEISEENIKLLEEFKAKIISLYPKQILRYVYINYPQYTENSLIKSEVLGDDKSTVL